MIRFFLLAALISNSRPLTCCSTNSLSLTNRNIPRIKRKAFEKYKKLEYLTLSNCGLRHISSEAFGDLPALRSLNLSWNFIRSLKEDQFTPSNRISELILSHNLIGDLDTFDLDFFPQLRVLDVSHNQIKYLPVKVVDRTRRDRNFVLITRGNPWDCENESWTSWLDEKFKLELCPGEELPQNLELKAPQQAGFVKCIFWSLGAFWIGVIVGNVCLIRRLLCGRKIVTKKTQSTQFDSYGLHALTKIYSKPSNTVTSANSGIYI